MKPALIVLDIQNAWLDTSPELKRSLEKRVKTINEAIGWFRRRKLPIIVVSHEERGRGVLPGVKAFEVFDKIDVKETDVKVTKRYPDAFGKTGLDGILKQKGCDTIVITGLSASWCVLGTYFGAMNWDIHACLLQGGVASDSEDHVRFAEEVCETTNLQKLDQALH